MQRLARANYKQTPWKNGLGVAAEIDRFPAGTGPYLWRLSQASITGDSEFSTFPGFDRWLAVWQGDSILLNNVQVPLHRPVRFSGDEKTFCRLMGAAVLDVGLIFDRSKITATMGVVEGRVQLAQGGVYYLFDLMTGDTIKFDHAAEISVEKSLLISVNQ